MTLTNKTKRFWIIVLPVIVITCVCFTGYRAARAEDKVEFLAYGVISVTNAQTAHFQVVSVGVVEIEPVELTFYDQFGNLLTQSSERLLPGRSASLNFTPNQEVVHRMEVYPVLRFINGKPKRGYVIPSLEVIEDSTGRAIFIVANPEG